MSTIVSLKNEAALLKRFAALGERIDREVGEVLSLTSEMVYTEVVTATPVDTGTARTSWNISIGAIDSYVPSYQNYPSMQSGNARPNAMRLAEQAVRPLRQPGAQVYTSVFITNGVDWIGELNQGSSRQAPADFVARSVMVVVQALRSGMFQRRLTELA